VSAALAAGALTGAGATSPGSVVFVDVGARRVDANITRDGVAVTALPIDAAEFEGFFAGRPQVAQKIVSQSVAPGTPIPIGATVDIVLAEPGTIPIKVVEGVHLDLREQTFATIYSDLIAPHPEIVRILARTATPDALTPADEQAIRDVFLQDDIAIGDEPGRDINAGFQTLKAGLTFGS
jgi:hypothetical protein